ncbi:sporulation protein YpjB [Peribacillus huizhouensis]|uniref:Sporulation protein YpjB n=1 Tax=Peribacillus huizhouensis TaxID=1501239 RepID=A0ABR6CRY2_9BACI|nr:sporulation protein YpjB [Peribacillus huizhouensis]MBA9027794.1 sporulation protein YpjB [Peribacillus huizhouensis]
MVKKILVLALLLIITVSFYQVRAEPSESMRQLDSISDEALRLVEMKRYQETDKVLQKFSELYLLSSKEKEIFNMAELRVVTVAYNDALEVVQTIEKTDSEKINAVTKFRLVLDAVSSNNQPLWMALEDPIMDAFYEAKEAVKIGDSERFNQKLNDLLLHYNIIYPSLKVSVPSEKLQQLDARVTYMDQYRPAMLTMKTNEQEWVAMEQDLKSLFDEPNEDEADPSLWWVIISTGSIIILTLSYVGWRKYKGNEKAEKPRKDHNV